MCVLLITQLLWLIGRLSTRKPINHTDGLLLLLKMTVLSRPAIIV